MLSSSRQAIVSWRTHAQLASSLPLQGAFCALLLFSALGCGSSQELPRGGGTGGTAAGAGGSAGAGGMPAAGGAEATGGAASSGGDASVCHASNLSSAPLQCLQDWSHATAKYDSKCSKSGGYQGFCDPYDTIIYESGSSNVWCYYDTATGNLIGARSTQNTDGTGGTCFYFDTSFSEPAIASCAPVSGSACTGP